MAELNSGDDHTDASTPNDANTERERLLALVDIFCPFLAAEGSCQRYLSLLECPFTHLQAPSKRRSLPSFLCIHYLLKECSSPVTRTSSRFPSCHLGLHPPYRDLLSLTNFTNEVGHLLHSHDQQEALKSSQVSREGGACLCPDSSAINLWAIFPCGHSRCGHCFMRRAQEERRNCDSIGCGKPIDRYFFWPTPLLTQEERAAMFRLEDKAVGGPIDLNSFEFGSW